MTDLDQDSRRQMGTAFLQIVGPNDISCLRGEAKPLREQALRLAKALKMQRLRRKYRTGQAYLAITLLLWSLIPLLPQTAPSMNMAAAQACLYTLTLATLIAGLAQAFGLARPEPIPQTI